MELIRFRWFLYWWIYIVCCHLPWKAKDFSNVLWRCTGVPVCVLASHLCWTVFVYPSVKEVTVLGSALKNILKVLVVSFLLFPPISYCEIFVCYFFPHSYPREVNERCCIFTCFSEKILMKQCFLLLFIYLLPLYKFIGPSLNFAMQEF